MPLKLSKHLISDYYRYAVPAYRLAELVGGGSVIKGATMSSLYIKVGCDGRCGEASEVLPACNTGLARARACARACARTQKTAAL